MSARETAWGAYKGIRDALRQRIAEGEFAAGSLLPSEAVLTNEFGVSRNTLRRALGDLEQEGLIRALPGRGRVMAGQGDAAEHEGDPHLQYRRIAADLRERIASGELQPGGLVPSEAALVAQYAVARGTARQALVELQGAGLIEAIQGKGRYVLNPSERDV